MLYFFDLANFKFGDSAPQQENEVTAMTQASWLIAIPCELY